MTQPLKTNLHFHTKKDPHHKAIGYDIKEGVDKASRLEFEVLGWTCHRSFMWNKEAHEYALEKNVLLIPGIEKMISPKKNKKGKEVIILNCNEEAEDLKTINDLREYKNKHPEVFLLAPHPFFYGDFSLKKQLEKNIDVFDAIEHSWFYSNIFNRNKKAEKVAREYNKPFIATSDTHFLNFLNTDYALISAEEKTAESILEAVKQNNFKNVTRPKNPFGEMFLPQMSFIAEDVYKKG